jgi:hypothetical protein
MIGTHRSMASGHANSAATGGTAVMVKATTALFERLREANILLQEVLSGAHDNMSEILKALAGLRRGEPSAHPIVGQIPQLPKIIGYYRGQHLLKNLNYLIQRPHSIWAMSHHSSHWPSGMDCG